MTQALPFIPSDNDLLVQPGDPSHDYCLWPYNPPAAPAPDALRSVSLLWHSFEVANVSMKMAPICAALRRAVGPFSTVWGVKHRDGYLSWEFYFYDYARTARRFGMRQFREATRGLLDIQVPDADDRPYFMFSVEIGPPHLANAPIEQIDIYIGNPDSALSSGICYGVSDAGIEMRNLYYFFDAALHHTAIRDKIQSNAMIPQPRLRMDRIVWPEMVRAQTIVVANKRHNDGLYFSRIQVDDLILFLERLQFPDAIVANVRAKRDRFSHLLFDVGYDYLPNPVGGLTYLKGSYYGLL